MTAHRFRKFLSSGSSMNTLGGLTFNVYFQTDKTHLQISASVFPYVNNEGFY